MKKKGVRKRQTKVKKYNAEKNLKESITTSII